MTAATSVGYKMFPDIRWPWVPVTTTSENYCVPPALQLGPINSTTMNVTWSHEGDKVVQSYSLGLRQLPATSNKTVITLPADARYYVLHGLDENVLYEVNVTEHMLDCSSTVVEEFHSLYTPLPPTPRNLHVTLRTADSISLAWVQPQTPMEISHYSVKYAEWTDSGAAPQWRFVTSDQTTALLEGLRPFTRYRMAVQAHTEHDASKNSTVISDFTREGVPSEPQNMRVSTRQPGSIVVEWSPPAVANGHIKTYIILYTSNPDNSDELWIHVTRNGSVRSATIRVEDKSGKLYYFKLQASTATGLGRPTNTVIVDPSVPDGNKEPIRSDDQRLGIIIGVSIGLFCIIICVFIILLRKRCFNMDYSSQPQTQVVRTHGNGHIPGSRLASTDTVAENRHSVGLYEMDAVTPMLEHLPENANSDSKGGGNGSMILTPNGAKLNGFVPLLKNGLRNGQLTNPNGQMGHVADHYRDGVMDVEETRGLIAAMLRGGDDHCIGAEDSFDVTRSGDLGSLDDIDHSHENMADPTLTKSQDSSLSEKSSSGGSDSVGMERNSDSLLYCSYSGGTMPRSDTTDTGDTVIFRASVVSGDRSMSSASGGESETACVLGEHLSGTTIPRSLSEAGHAVGDTERNCHDTNNIRDTHRQETPSALSGAALPQYQLSTSNQPQVLGSACVDRNASSRCPDSRSDHRSERAVVHDAGSNYDGGGGGNSHVHSNGEPRWGRNRAAPSQGDADLSPVRAAYNPTIPHAPSREITPVQQSGDVTLAEIPQDVLKGKASSRQRPNHFKV